MEDGICGVAAGNGEGVLVTLRCLSDPVPVAAAGLGRARSSSAKETAEQKLFLLMISFPRERASENGCPRTAIVTGRCSSSLREDVETPPKRRASLSDIGELSSSTVKSRLYCPCAFKRREQLRERRGG